jgi:hypothetical protein
MDMVILLMSRGRRGGDVFIAIGFRDFIAFGTSRHRKGGEVRYGERGRNDR